MENTRTSFELDWTFFETYYFYSVNNLLCYDMKIYLGIKYLSINTGFGEMNSLISKGLKRSEVRTYGMDSFESFQ